MIETIDIIEKIKTDFGEKASGVFWVFEKAVSMSDYLNNNKKFAVLYSYPTRTSLI